MSNNVKFALFFLLSLMLFLQGCVQNYFNQLSSNLNQNINYLKIASTEVKKDEIDVYKQGSISPDKIDLSRNSCQYGRCNYFFCYTRDTNNVNVDDDERVKDPYFYIYGRNLTNEISCSFRSAVSDSKDVELTFLYLFLVERDSNNNKLNTERKIGVSMGNSFYEFNEANPSCKNYLSYPIQFVRGDNYGYILSPTVKKAIKEFNEKNTIPVFIFKGFVGFPKKYLSTTEDIVSYIAEQNSKGGTAIIFTEANLDYAKRGTNKYNTQIDLVVNQLNAIYNICKPPGVTMNNINQEERKYRCIPGISIPFDGADKEYSYQFFKDVQKKYISKYGYLTSQGAIPGEGFRDIVPFVGFSLITSKASSCDGYALISDAVQIAKKFTFNLDQVGSLGYYVSYPVFIQELVFDESPKCKFGKTLRKQTYFALYNMGIPAFLRAGIVNIPSKKYYFPDIFTSLNKNARERRGWAEKSNGVPTPFSDEEYSYYFSYCQEFYDLVNYPNIAYRGGYGEDACPLQLRIPEIKYERRQRGYEKNLDPLFDVNPATSVNIMPPFYRGESCFLNTSYDDFFKSSTGKKVIGKAVSSSICRDDISSEIEFLYSLLGADIDFGRAMRVENRITESYRIQNNNRCSVEFVPEFFSFYGMCKSGMSYTEVESALINSGCSTGVVSEEYFYDVYTKRCFPESYFVTYDQNGNKKYKENKGVRCVPCYLGEMGVSYKEGSRYSFNLQNNQVEPRGVYFTAGVNYNPFDLSQNIMSSAVRIVFKAKSALDVVNNPSLYSLPTTFDDEEKGLFASYFTAYLYRNSNWDKDDDQIEDIDTLYDLVRIFNNAKSLEFSSDKDAACNSASDEIKDMCCRAVSKTDQNGNTYYEWKYYSINNCCRVIDKGKGDDENFKNFLLSCDRGKLGYAYNVLNNYKGVIITCNTCYSPYWKLNACNYAKELTDTTCDNSFNLVDPEDPIDIFDAQEDLYIETVNEVLDKCQERGLGNNCGTPIPPP